MKYFLVLSLFVLSLFTGCAHSLLRGSVAMKVSDTEAHVCMGDKEVSSGDKVALYKSVCRSITGGREGGGSSCEKVKLGEGVVTQTLNDHYSLIHVNKDVKFEEGTIVEKL
ncbi:MAG: hypothetical protein CL678_14235 [Bdellovibrionaceae bacterium]|nr:hypothetical protein [Pseudobdellovibrionaceae bacterium]|tara:strand:- start:2555 stop:2887 length:333 start_codon:yes stop_codon:yes gene_type:complete